jgi:hypothetical protein
MKTIISIKRISMVSIIIFTMGLLLFSPNDAIRGDFHHKVPDPEIERYRSYLLLLSDGKLGDSKVPIGFRKFPEDSTIAGTCNISLKNLQFEIDINKELWQYENEWWKLFLLAHEFLHTCPKGHNDELLKGDQRCPRYLNSALLISDTCMMDNLEYYVSLLKKGCSQGG